MKKQVVSALVSALAMLATTIAIGYLFDFLFSSLKTEYANTNLYRPWEDPLMYLFFLQPFIFCGTMVWGWDKIKSHFAGSVGRKAFNVALIMLFLSIIPGMIMTLSSFKVSPLALMTWTISAFFQVFVASLIFVRMSK